jgi:hypothetical protein
METRLSDVEIRMWAIEQSIKWRASTNNSESSESMARKYYRWAKEGFDR